MDMDEGAGAHVHIQLEVQHDGIEDARACELELRGELTNVAHALEGVASPIEVPTEFRGKGGVDRGGGGV